ncbi:MAG: acetyl-CoA carboxylase biotin carboxylase subunit, partial [Lachnospiraceae bacterium]|nr:acetyl-CoA carboxylase biotin carboxylase subunit [Lachnospiraceae bacterium]
MFRKILIANRGEIAIRIMRACTEMNIGTVGVYSTADKDSLHVKFADETICIGPSQAGESYLKMDALITAAKAMGCDALHPGYGFLSENPEFVRRCNKAGIVFIGPTAEAMDILGNKIKAKRLVKETGVPIVPGSDGSVNSYEELERIAKEIGYPVIIKASAGGGGRGMRSVFAESDLRRLYEEARSEAKACFGNDEIYLEKLITDPRHIEVQILADEHGHVIHLGERDCSIQRKNQKLIEESPGLFISDDIRNAMREAAVKISKAAGYTNAGTIEFLLDNKEKFYFIEMNTRIQQEHGVTEMVTGVDLVQEQIRLAHHGVLNLKQEDVKISGYAIECRINAEDPTRNFLPNSGKVSFLQLPGGPGVRVDTMLYDGYE